MIEARLLWLASMCYGFVFPVSGLSADEYFRAILWFYDKQIHSLVELLGCWEV